MKIKKNLIILMFVFISTSKVFAAATMTCSTENLHLENQRHSISLGGGGFISPSWLNLDIRNLHHRTGGLYAGEPPYLYQGWHDETEYRLLLGAGERYIQAIDVTIYFGLDLHLLYTGISDVDNFEIYVGRYEIIVQSGGYSFRDGGTPLDFFRVVNVDWGDVLNIRAEPNADARKVGEIPAYGYGVIGFSVQPVAGWVFVNYGGIEGWVSERYLADGRRTDNEFIGEIVCRYGR